jgi:hypothetical protein
MMWNDIPHNLYKNVLSSEESNIRKNEKKLTVCPPFALMYA